MLFLKVVIMSGRLIRIRIQMYTQNGQLIRIRIQMYPQSGLLIRIHIKINPQSLVVFNDFVVVVFVVIVVVFVVVVFRKHFFFRIASLRSAPDESDNEKWKNVLLICMSFVFDLICSVFQVLLSEYFSYLGREVWFFHHEGGVSKDSKKIKQHYKVVYLLDPVNFPKRQQKNLTSLEVNMISFSVPTLASRTGEHL